MASSSLSSEGRGPPSDDDEPADDAAMPLTMAASVILTSLPKDASTALVGAGDLPQAKGLYARSFSEERELIF